MARYIKRFNKRVGLSLGPSEERHFELWVGFDIEGTDRDLTHVGLIRVDDEAIVAEHRVDAFKFVGLDDHELRRKLGIRPNDD